MSEIIKRVRPIPSNEYLANPHRGCCAFQKFNGDPLFPNTTWSEDGPTEFPPATLAAPRGFSQEYGRRRGAVGDDINLPDNDIRSS